MTCSFKPPGSRRVARSEAQPENLDAASRPSPIPFIPARRSVVGSSHDPVEADADHLAEIALARLGGPDLTTINHQGDPAREHIRRQVDSQLHGTIGPAGGAVDQAAETLLDQNRQAGGHPLPPRLRSAMEIAFDTKFDTVRIHRDTTAARLNSYLSARAFTTGPDIFFARDQYAPHTPTGLQTLAHELGHVAQQRRTSSLSHLPRVDIDDSATAGGEPAPRAQLNRSVYRTSGVLRVDSADRQLLLTRGLLHRVAGVEQLDPQEPEAPEVQQPKRQPELETKQRSGATTVPRDSSIGYKLAIHRMMTEDPAEDQQEHDEVKYEGEHPPSDSEDVDVAEEATASRRDDADDPPQENLGVDETESFLDEKGNTNIGGKTYTRPRPENGGKTFERGKEGSPPEEGLWRVKDTSIQRSRAEEELIGSLLYGELTEQRVITELHYHESHAQGVIVKQHLPTFRTWCDYFESDCSPHNVLGLGLTAVAAWFLGDNDMHNANFGTVDEATKPQIVVVDPSGAFYSKNLQENSLTQSDFDDLPLRPKVHATRVDLEDQRSGYYASNWDLQQGVYEGERQDGNRFVVPDEFETRLREEKKEALNRIKTLNFGALAQKVREQTFYRGVSFREDPEDKEENRTFKEWQKVAVFDRWKQLVNILEKRRADLAAIVINPQTECLPGQQPAESTSSKRKRDDEQGTEDQSRV